MHGVPKIYKKRLWGGGSSAFKGGAPCPLSCHQFLNIIGAIEQDKRKHTHTQISLFVQLNRKISHCHEVEYSFFEK